MFYLFDLKIICCALTVAYLIFCWVRNKILQFDIYLVCSCLVKPGRIMSIHNHNYGPIIIIANITC